MSQTPQSHQRIHHDNGEPLGPVEQYCRVPLFRYAKTNAIADKADPGWVLAYRDLRAAAFSVRPALAIARVEPNVSGSEWSERGIDAIVDFQTATASKNMDDAAIDAELRDFLGLQAARGRSLYDTIASLESLAYLLEKVWMLAVLQTQSDR